MLPWSDWVVPSARKTGDEGEAHLHRPFDNPHDAVREIGTYGGRRQSRWPPPTALLFAVQSIQDQQNQTLNQHDCSHPRDGKH
jgi:hypothetical protein